MKINHRYECCLFNTKIDSRGITTWEAGSEIENLLKEIKNLEGCIEGENSGKIITATDELRKAADNLEGLIPNNLWPLPSYAEMMFML